MVSKAYSSYEIVGVNHLEITINLASAESSVLRTAELDECGNWRKQETAVRNQTRTEHVDQSYDYFKILLLGQLGDSRSHLLAQFVCVTRDPMNVICVNQHYVTFCNWLSS
jgi:hypothetical protein